MEGNIGFMLKPDPPKVPGSACFTLPKCRMWRKSLAKKVLWHMVELSHTTATCLRALVMATFILLLSPRNPTAPNVFDRTYIITQERIRSHVFQQQDWVQLCSSKDLSCLTKNSGLNRVETKDFPINRNNNLFVQNCFWEWMNEWTNEKLKKLG